MSDYILFADDQDFRCDDCGKRAILVTGCGDILCEYCYGISLGMEPTEEDYEEIRLKRDSEICMS